MKKILLTFFIFIAIVVSYECEILRSGKWMTFSSTEMNHMEEGLYNVICVGECDRNFNRDIPPYLVDCLLVDDMNMRWRCFSNYGLITDARVSCLPCADPSTKNIIIKHSCIVEVEKWGLRGL
jgi:hypothetical protein